MRLSSSNCPISPETRFILQLTINGKTSQNLFKSKEERTAFIQQMIYDGREIRVHSSCCWVEKTLTDDDKGNEIVIERNFLTMVCTEFFNKVTS